MRLSEEQKFVIKEVVRQKKQVQVVSGYAGTGKSTLIRHLADILPGFSVCAFTGKAANVLRSKGIKARTIHSLIYKAFPDDEGKVHFSLAGSLECDGVIVDEASMVSEYLHRDLLSFGIPVIFVGDHGQLEPVGDKFNIMSKPDYVLETIHRNAGEIAHFAEYIRKGFKPSSWEIRNGAGKKIKFVPKFSHRSVACSVDQVICAYNKTRSEINSMVREETGRGSGPEKGDRVMCLRNDAFRGLFNGMQGVIEHIYPNDFMLFKSEENFFDIPFERSVFNQVKYDFDGDRDSPLPFDYAYCVTCHKCVHPDTMVETDQGLLAIKDISPTGLISTPQGNYGYKNFVRNPPLPCVRIVCKDGYEITTTDDHKAEIWDGSEFSRILSGEIKEGDILRVKIGVGLDVEKRFRFPPHQVKDVREKRYETPKELTEDLAEFLGLMVADGTIFGRGFRLLKRHKDVIDRFKLLCESLFGAKPYLVKVGKTKGYEVSSTFITRWLHSIGGMSPNAKDVPDCILRSPLNIQNKFLKGLFEDGTVNMKGNKVDHIEFVSIFPELRNKVRNMLLRAGVVASSCGEKIYIYGDFCQEFRKSIGFVSSFKNKRMELCKAGSRYKVPFSEAEIKLLKNHLPKSDYSNLKFRKFLTRKCANKIRNLSLIKDKMKYHYVAVKKIEKLDCETMCVEVPKIHKFYQNGFPFGNCQGSEFDSVLVLEQRCDLWDHKRWAYTAASRAKEKLFWCEFG